MRAVVLIILLSLSVGRVYSQQHSLAKLWDKRYGGLLYDELYSCIQTSDGGYLLGGGVYSGIGGDKTQDNWDTTYNTYDFWVVKIDSLGNKEWDRRFGGLSDDGIQPSSLTQTIDGGYVLGGVSSSGIGGDKSQQSWGGFDYWMVKIDASGNKLWDMGHGGSSAEYIYALENTTDGGYIMGGTSYSDSSGDKTQNNWGGTDYWVVKTDSAGNKIWDKRFGGYADDFLYAMQPTQDGGYILGGISQSDTGGDKTQPNWAVGWYNFWVIKIDAVGNKLWDRVYGGTEEDDLKAIVATQDGGFLLGGYSLSGISGDKTQPLIDGAYNYWIVRIDSAGNKLWDKDYGGTGGNQLYSLALTSDGGFLLSGNSNSPASGDKTENNSVAGSVKTWLIKTDSAGKLWDKTIFVNGSTTLANAFQTMDGCYVIGTFTPAESGYYKSQPSWDSSADYWIVKFRDTTIISGIAEITRNLQLNVYPNPFTSELDITLAQQNLTQADFSICNILGQTIYTQHETNLSPTYTKMLDLSYLPNGVYLVEVVVDGEVSVREVIKQ